MRKQNIEEQRRSLGEGNNGGDQYDKKEANKIDLNIKKAAGGGGHGGGGRGVGGGGANAFHHPDKSKKNNGASIGIQPLNFIIFTILLLICSFS